MTNKEAFYQTVKYFLTAYVLTDDAVKRQELIDLLYDSAQTHTTLPFDTRDRKSWREGIDCLTVLQGIEFNPKPDKKDNTVKITNTYDLNSLRDYTQLMEMLKFALEQHKNSYPFSSLIEDVEDGLPFEKFYTDIRSQLERITERVLEEFEDEDVSIENVKKKGERYEALILNEFKIKVRGVYALWSLPDVSFHEAIASLIYSAIKNHK